MPGRRSIVSVRRCAPSLRASVGRDRLLEKQPDVPAIARARSLQGRRQIQPTTGFQDRSRILLPLRLVQVGRQEEAGFIPEQRVNAHDEVAPGVVVAGKMPANDLVGDGQEVLIRTCGAFDPGLLAQARRPFVATRGRISRLAGLAILEAARIDIVSSAKERAKQGDLGLRRGQVMDKSVRLLVVDGRRFGRFNTHHIVSAYKGQVDELIRRGGGLVTRGL